jgi:hypothetical protein
VGGGILQRVQKVCVVWRDGEETDGGSGGVGVRSGGEGFAGDYGVSVVYIVSFGCIVSSEGCRRYVCVDVGFSGLVFKGFKLQR